MKSRNLPYISKIDHLRFSAAAIVLAYHFSYSQIAENTWNPILRIIKDGYTGVSFFMVLSGFIFTLISFEKEVNYKSFIYNRLIRVYPLYIVCVMIATYSGGRRVDAVSLGALMVFFGNLTGVSLPQFAHIWTIMVEFQIYMIFPFLIIFLNRRGLPYLIGLVGMILLIRLILFLTDGTVQDAAYWTILGRLDQFVIGMAAAVLYNKRRLDLSNPFFLLLSLILLWSWLILFHEWCGGYYGPQSPRSPSIAWVIGPMLEAVAFGAVMLAYLGQTWAIPKAVDRGLAYLGAISFSIYVWHFPIVQLIHRYMAGSIIYLGWVGALLLVAFPLTLLVSSLSFHVIEQPFSAMRKVYVRDRKLTTAEVVALSAEPQRI